jgi:hypothetical protein
MIAQKITISYTITKRKNAYTVSPSISMEITLEKGENRTACMEQTMAYVRELVNQEATQALAQISERQETR